MWLKIELKTNSIKLNILYHNLGRFDWKKTDDISVSRYPGEWYVVDCQLQDRTTKVSLWKSDKGSEKEVDADQHTVTESNQIYNVTNVTSSDEGNYYCRAQYRDDNLHGHLYVKSGMCTK